MSLVICYLTDDILFLNLINFFQNQHLTIMSVEIFCKTRRNLNPDPQIDAIHAIYYAVAKETHEGAPKGTGVFLFDEKHTEGCANEFLRKGGVQVTSLKCFKDEKDMLLEFALFVKLVDPDMIMGYEVQMLSWGYIIERGAVLNLNMCHLLSRIVDKETPITKSSNNENADNWFGQLINMTITGRIILNVWRVMRSEVSKTNCVIFFLELCTTLTWQQTNLFFQYFVLLGNSTNLLLRKCFLSCSSSQSCFLFSPNTYRLVVR